MKRQLNWIQGAIGCYWSADDSWQIRTRVAIVNGKHVLTYPQSGYVLSRNYREIGLYKSLKAAQRTALTAPTNHGTDAKQDETRFITKAKESTL